MNLKQLEYFVHVAEMGSFTRASAFLRIAQPALSRQVRALEVELRQALLQRNGRGVTPTESGKRLLAHARGILQQVQRARDELEAQRGAATGRLTLALPPSISRSLTVPLVQAFRQQLPRASLCVVEGLSAYALEWLGIGRVDAAVVYNVTPTPAIDLQPLRAERLMLVSARASGARRVGAPLPLRRLAEQALVMPSRPHSMRMRLEAALAAQGLRPRVALEIESVPAILELVQQGGLHALLTENAIRGSDQAEAFALRPITPPLVATLWLATSAQRPRGPLLERGAAIVQELLKPGRTGMLHRH